MLRALFIPLLLVAGLAHADDGEWRIAAGGGGSVTTASAGGAEGTGMGFEAHGRVGRGITNAVELGVAASYSDATDVAFAGATLDRQIGTLYADVHTVSLGIELRLTPGVALARAFERTGPYLAVRAGGAFGVRTNQQIFTGANLLLAAPPDTVELGIFVRGALGVEHRFGDHLFVSAELGATRTSGATLFDFTAEATWAWY